MSDLVSTAPTATGNGADACVPSGAGTPVSQSAGAASQNPEWMHPMIQAARAATIDYLPGSPAAAVSALATYRAAVQLALRHLFAGLGETAVRNTLTEGMLLAEGYVGRLDDAAGTIAELDRTLPRARLLHYVVEGTFQQGRVYLNRCVCGRTYYRMGLPDEYQAARHVHVMSLPNILSGECDCPGNRDAIPVFEGRCTGCGAVLSETALTNRKGAA